MSRPGPVWPRSRSLVTEGSDNEPGAYGLRVGAYSFAVLAGGVPPPLLNPARFFDLAGAHPSCYVPCSQLDSTASHRLSAMNVAEWS